MVMRGQFLERPTLIPVEEWVLEGLSHRGERAPPLLVLPPAGEGGGMDHVVGAELAWAATHAGHPTLRFNYRGIGGSQGQPGDAQSRLRDAEAALRVLGDTTETAEIAAVALGGSAPTLLELCARHPGLVGLGFVSPREVEPEAFLQVQRALLVVQGQKEDALPRAALSAAVTEAGGVLELIPGADAAFTRNLSSVGKAVTEWLAGLVPS